jgi:hypothetical protein
LTHPCPRNTHQAHPSRPQTLISNPHLKPKSPPNYPVCKTLTHFDGVEGNNLPPVPTMESSQINGFRDVCHQEITASVLEAFGDDEPLVIAFDHHLRLAKDKSLSSLQYLRPAEECCS